MDLKSVKPGTPRFDAACEQILNLCLNDENGIKEVASSCVRDLQEHGVDDFEVDFSMTSRLCVRRLTDKMYKDGLWCPNCQNAIDTFEKYLPHAVEITKAFEALLNSTEEFRSNDDDDCEKTLVVEDFVSGVYVCYRRKVEAMAYMVAQDIIDATTLLHDDDDVATSVEHSDNATSLFHWDVSTPDDASQDLESEDCSDADVESLCESTVSENEPSVLSFEDACVELCHEQIAICQKQKRELEEEHGMLMESAFDMAKDIDDVWKVSSKCNRDNYDSFSSLCTDFADAGIDKRGANRDVDTPPPYKRLCVRG